MSVPEGTCQIIQQDHCLHVSSRAALGTQVSRVLYFCSLHLSHRVLGGITQVKYLAGNIAVDTQKKIGIIIKVSQVFIWTFHLRPSYIKFILCFNRLVLTFDAEGFYTTIA